MQYHTNVEEKLEYRQNLKLRRGIQYSEEMVQKLTIKQVRLYSDVNQMELDGSSDTQ